ncbi:MAG: AsmA family protein, partial [Candidatus Omnitrophota bacterium]|nr:AsmA family protein [Candidatus Omnitrophota bacterium]
MKKIFIILAVIFLIFITAIIIFALTFDVNRYKGIIIEKASQAMQKDITLERISLNFSHGLGCRIDGLVLKEKNTGWDSAWLKAASVEISVRILPLFKKDVQVNRIEIQRLDLKLSDELLKQPMQSVDSSQEKPGTGTIALGALKFLARAIVIKDSVITYIPTKSEDTIKIGISTLMLNNVSLSGPVRISAVLSTLDKGRDNIIVKGIVFPELSTKTPYIKDLDLKIDTSGIDLPGFLRTFGYDQVAGQLSGKEMRGIIAIHAEKLFLDQNKVFDSNVSLKLSEFETDAVPLKGGVKNLMLDAELSGGNLIIKNCSGLVAGGNISVSLTIKDLPSVINKKSAPYLKAVRARIDLDGLDVQSIASVVNNEDVKKYLSGVVLKGVVFTQAEKLYLDPEKIWDSDITISLEKCSANILAVPGSIKDVDIEAHFGKGDLVIEKLSGIVAGGLISVSGTVKNVEAVVSQKGTLETENVIMQFNLQDFNILEFLAMSGNEDIAKTLKEKTIAGKVTVKSDKFSLNQKEKPSGLSILLSQGMTDIIPIQGGVKDIELNATLEQNDLLVHKLMGSAASGTFSIQGSVKDIFSSQFLNFDISCSGINLDSLLP